MAGCLVWVIICGCLLVVYCLYVGVLVVIAFRGLCWVDEVWVGLGLYFGLCLCGLVGLLYFSGLLLPLMLVCGWIVLVGFVVMVRCMLVFCLMILLIVVCYDVWMIYGVGLLLCGGLIGTAGVRGCRFWMAVVGWYSGGYCVCG